ncbi:TIGR01244 family phosphatase [Rhodobacteraceae bacterium F11138]|nr:TIGR01244 family phosphatase [Rhodobacteraceae bacterium F11138]
MEMRPLSPRYSVSPQISAEDISAIAQAGISLVVCNRPDQEVPPSHQSKAIADAVRAAGMRFEFLPLTHQTMTPENVALQHELIEDAEGPVLAYCASGTRSSVVWALGEAKTRSPDEILADTAAAGYQLDGLRPTLEQLSRS